MIESYIRRLVSTEQVGKRSWRRTFRSGSSSEHFSWMYRIRSRASSRYWSWSLSVHNDQRGVIQAVDERTKFVCIYSSENNQLIPVLHQALQCPIQRGLARLIRTARAQEHAGVAGPLVAFALHVKRVREHACLRILERVERDLRLVALRGNERARRRERCYGTGRSCAGRCE